MNRIEQALNRSKDKPEAASDVDLFISNAKVADAVFNDLEKSAKGLILNTLTKMISKQVETVAKKHNVQKDSRIKVPGFGTAYLFDIYEQLLSDHLQVVQKNKPISR